MSSIGKEKLSIGPHDQWDKKIPIHLGKDDYPCIWVDNDDVPEGFGTEMAEALVEAYNKR